MKRLLIYLTIILHACGVPLKSPEELIKELNESTAEESRRTNAKILAWETTFANLDSMSNADPLKAKKIMDGLLMSDSLTQEQRIDLHFIKGTLFYIAGDFDKSVSEYTLADNKFGAPKYLAARAGSYLKLGEFDLARVDLFKAADVNHYYYWNVGNLYEALNNKDSAIYYYELLYSKDTLYYKYCNDRVRQLNSKDTKLFNELQFYDRTRMVVTLQPKE